jgi:hypothetical protein
MPKGELGVEDAETTRGGVATGVLGELGKGTTTISTAGAE